MNRHPSAKPCARARIAAVLLAVAALACKTTGAFVPVEQYVQPAPETEHRITPGDVLAIRVWNQEAMSNPHARVRDDGKISIPFLQDVDVAGSTPVELAQRLQVKLKAYVVNPIVTVTVEEMPPLRVSVVGEVARPGQYDLERGAGVLSALAAAGGVTDYAHRDRIFVVRSSGASMVRIQFRYSALTSAEAKASSFRIRPGDVVVVE